MFQPIDRPSSGAIQQYELLLYYAQQDAKLDELLLYYAQQDAKPENK
jgi:hypothetical protein